ncbi:MAG: RcnB family protein, partial [Hyphomonadaceae bacterium]
SPWRAGYRVPAYYAGPRYVVYDYGRYRLRPPPRGYHWVRDDRGDFLLAAIATGIIADVIINGR